MKNRYIFLLYVGLTFIITFVQQEFVLLPELQSLDLVGEEVKAKMLDKWQQWRWVSFVVIPLLLFFRLCLVTLCLFIGSFFFSNMVGQKFKDWWGITMVAQSVILLYSIIICAIDIATKTDQVLYVTKCTSLIFLGGENDEQWIKIPLSAINIFEIAYWFVISKLVSRKTETSFGHSFKFVMSSYGVGYLFYIVLLMFLVLYLN